jgi:hypothetical protein
MATKARVRAAPDAPRTRYEDDLYTWVEEQVALLRAGRLTEIDAQNIAEELGDVARSERRSLVSAVAVLTLHLLKWDHQSAKRSRSWVATVNEQRQEIHELLERNPGMKPQIEEAMRIGYAKGRHRAVAETNLEYEIFPELCPYSFEEIMTRPIVYEPAEAPRRRKRSASG